VRNRLHTFANDKFALWGNASTACASGCDGAEFAKWGDILRNVRNPLQFFVIRIGLLS
jgi:hypothetical protein